MEPVILLIRQVGQPDIIDSFTDEDAARGALIRFVRQQPARSGTVHAEADDQAVASWFATDEAFYAITRLTLVTG